MPYVTATKTKVSTRTKVIIVVAFLAGAALLANALLPRLNQAVQTALLVTRAKDSPAPATLAMGETNRELARFQLKNTLKDQNVLVNRVIINDVTANPGTLRNIKLRNLTTGLQLGVTDLSLDPAPNASAPVAEFNRLMLYIQPNTTVVLAVTADIVTWVEGGVSGATHRLELRPDYSAAAGTQPGVTATLADGQSAAQIDYSSSRGNTMTVYRAKITATKAADAPSGNQTASAEATVAKFVVSNTSPDNFTATLKLMNLDIVSTGISLTASSTLRVYKDTVLAGNQLASTIFTKTINDTAFKERDFGDVEIAAGRSTTFLVTLDTTSATAGDSLRVGLANGDILWSDGISTAISAVDSLPVAGSTLSY